jgi:hypothetical protein
MNYLIVFTAYNGGLQEFGALQVKEYLEMLAEDFEISHWPLWLGTDVQDYSASVTTCNTFIGPWNPLYDQTLTLLSAAACV